VASEDAVRGPEWSAVRGVWWVGLALAFIGGSVYHYASIV
jgi:hypothetical protein